MKDFLNKNKFYIVLVLVVLLFFGKCRDSRNVRILENENTKLAKGSESTIDSLNNIIYRQTQTIDSFPERLRTRELEVHMFYDNWISDKDRGRQLMQLHRVVKENIHELD